ncbi:MAG: hypothetical protein EZS28_011013 [Streblomastix strix]|uniref:Uncharacterized protein n=1 Tax=Streblomastix strix TaxID=222440 RepID=A0A5J4WEQ9_9EUKA|nr:MAG: hypothetical protein EZS28_011013 [Streblomastix strix]
MIHPAIGGTLGARANIACAVDRLMNRLYAANNQIVDGMASDYALQIEPNGLLTIKNLKMINFDFVAQINQLINQVNSLQQSIGTTEQDITDIKNDIDTINQELSRQTHFRGYYLLNTDIQNLPNSANGDFTFSAESGTVWMYDQNWYYSGDIVPDQVTPASDATPLSDGTATAGTSNEYSRGDHVPPLNIITIIPPSDSASGSVGTSNYYARSDHSHPINITTTIPPSDFANETVGITNYYARHDRSNPVNVHDHVHPQQLTYDVNVTVIKFIKTGGLATEILCVNGDTTIIDTQLSRTYSGSGWIRLCVFPAGANIGIPFIEFKLYSSYIADQIIRLQPNYTVNAINTVYGIFTAPTKVSSYQEIDNGVNQLFLNHSGTGTAAIYSAYIQLESVGTTIIVVIDLSIYYINRFTDILTQDTVPTVPTGIQILINYNFGYGGIMSNTLQVIPTERMKSNYNNRIRIRTYVNESALYLACSNTAINTNQVGQWEISKTNDRALTINPSFLRQADHNDGLSINSESSKITFNSLIQTFYGLYI